MPEMQLLPGDCRDSLDILSMLDEQFDAVVTDPPYHLTSVVERFGKPGSAPAQFGTDGAFARASRGFMGKEWDGGDIAFQVDFWRKVFDVMKPGAHLAAFGGTRTFHRMAVAIEDAGFEIRDTLMWLYGTGFPKSHDISKAIDKAAGAERTDGAREWTGGKRCTGIIKTDERDGTASRTIYDTPATPEAAQWQGWGSALKPSVEPIILARKPLIGTLAANTLQHGVGGLNIDACRIPLGEDYDPAAVQRQSSNRVTWEGGENSGFASDHVQQTYNQAGRWPSNIIHDGSDEVLEAFAAFGESKSTVVRAMSQAAREPKAKGAGKARVRENVGYTDTGTAARFFYQAKAGAADRAGSKHPTVKPLSLIRWLCTLVTPPGGRILDPFAGSGTTLQAGYECGFHVTGCEREPEYIADIRRRIATVETNTQKAA